MSVANQDSGTARASTARRSALVFLLPVIVLLSGIFLALMLMRSSPKAELGPADKRPRLVQTRVVQFSKQQLMVQAMGTVIPARQIEIKPRGNGVVARVSDDFVPGGRLQRGEVMLTLDPVDFELAVREREGDLQQAQSELALEMGRQKFASKEYALRQNEVSEEDRALMLRKPQLLASRAALTKVKITLEQAQLNLQRTVITAPFNAMIRERMVDVGVQVTTATPLAVLYATDRFWVRLAVPVDKLPWIVIPNAAGEAGSNVRIYNEAAWGKGSYRVGQLIRLTGDLENEGRMAQLLVALDDPLSLAPENSDKPVMLLGSYLRVVIEGIELDSVVALDRSLLHNGAYVWLMDENNELVIRAVDVLFRGPDVVLIGEGLAEGERLVTSVLSAPVPGMKLREKSGSDL